MLDKIKMAQIIAIVISTIAMVLSLIALNNTMYKDIHKKAYNEGFNACIEENNLYERYGGQDDEK